MPIHRLPIPTPFAVGPVNVYLAEGEPLTLIDTGPKDPPSLAALETALAALGYRVEDIRQLILTHHHVDHIGLAAEIVARSGAEVITHPYTVPWLTDYAAEQHRKEPLFHQIWKESGVPEDIENAMREGARDHAHWTAPVPVARTIDEGDAIAFAGTEWRVYHTPGHAGGLICLWDESARTLLANDHIIRDISSNAILEPSPLTAGPRPKRLVEYLHHFHRMAALNPALALPGHGEPVDDVPGLLRQRLNFHHRRMQKILNVLAAQPMTLYEITKPIFPKLSQGVEFFLGLSEILGHLDLLEEAGQARPVCDGELVRWTKIN